METPVRHNWWTTLPGILTGIAGLITAIAALIGSLHLIGVVGDDDSSMPDAHESSGVITTSTAPSPTEPADLVTEGADPTGVPPAPVWKGSLNQGTLTMKSGDTAILKDSAVGVAAPGGDFLLSQSSDSVSISRLYEATHFGTITDTPTKATCRTSLGGQKYTEFDADTTSLGVWWCINTADGYIGALRVREIVADAPQRVVLDFVLWS